MQKQMNTYKIMTLTKNILNNYVYFVIIVNFISIHIPAIEKRFH